MKIESIVTIADKTVELRFLAMVRSLRAMGCTIPVNVIPYSENEFALPPGCEYLRDEKVFKWLERYPASGVKRKYMTLTLSNYQFVDSDVVFLKNPADVLREYNGFVTCCGHWRDADHTVTSELTQVLRQRSSLWQRLVFNSGQFACDERLYSLDELITRAEEFDARATVLEHQFHEQPGINHLVLTRKVAYTNLTLPPFNFESSWAGDYCADEIPSSNEFGPYLLHWAGMPRGVRKPIDQLYLQYLSAAEQRKLFEDDSAAGRISIGRRFRQLGLRYFTRWRL